MNIATVIVLGGILIVLLVGFINITKVLYTYIDGKISMEKLELYNNIYNSTENVERILDEYISSEYDIYKVYNTELFEKEYLKDNDLAKICNSLYDQVLRHMSPSLHKIVCLVYNSDVLDEIITRKIEILIVADGINHNSDNNININDEDNLFPL